MIARIAREHGAALRALEGLPALEEALRGGALGWCAVREIVRVAIVETEQAWLEAARGKTLRESCASSTPMAQLR